MPEGLKLERTACGLAGWSLAWKPVQGAEAGYAVLLADADGDGKFRVLGETKAANQVEFPLPASRVKGIARPVFSVVARVPKGDTVCYGKRAVGVLMNYSVPVSLGVNDLPFEEEFIRYPSVHFQMEAGSNVEATYLTRSVSYLKPGSNIFEFVCVKTPTDFDTADYFNPANASNIARMWLCELDLTSIPANEKVVLHILGNLVTPVETDTLTARCRVLAGSDGNQLLRSLEGGTVNMPSEYDQNWYYELEGGIRHRVVIEFSGAERNDLLAVGKVSVGRPQVARSVALKLEEVPADGPNLGQGNFTLWVTNQSVAPEEELLVKAYRGDRWVQSTTVSLRGMQSKMVKIPVDLSTTEAEGELIPIRFECVVDPLNPTANGRVQHSVYNYGQVVPIGTSHLEEGLYGLVNVDPKITYTVQGKVVFTDNGGLLRPYSGQQSSTIKFLPSDPSMRVRIRFTYFNTTYNQAALAVYTMQSPDNLSRDGLRVRQVMMGDVVGPSTPSCTFVSEAADGGVLLYFASGDAGVEGGGWKAVVDMVPSMNPIALTGVEATRLGGDAEAKIPVGVRVLNRWKYPQSNVVVNVIGENGYLMLDTLKEVAPGEALYTVGDGLKVRRAEPVFMQVALEGNDTKGADNEMNAYAIYDRYCAPSPHPLKGPSLHSLGVFNTQKELSSNKTGAMRYTLTEPLKIYRDEGNVDLTVALDASVPDGWSLALWVDWDDNGTFDAHERLLVALKKGGRKTIVQLELGNKPLGIKRIRLQVGPTAEVGDPCSAPLLGDMQDGALELVEGLFVHRDDLELADLYIGESGRNLSATQPIQITLSNLSNREFSGKLKVRVTVDGRPSVDELVDCGDANALAPYRGMRDFTLSTTADCTGIGRHTVKVELVDNPGTANNSRQANVYSIVPEPDGFYAVSLKSEAEHNERISVPTVAYALRRDEVDEWTMEMVFRTEGPQFGTLLEAYGFKVYTTYHLVDGIPDNAIGLLIGENMQVWTPAQSVEPGVWHHLAIVVEHIERGLSGNSCDVAVYIDGQRQRLQYFGAQDAPSFGTGGMSLYLLPRIDAQIKLFRAYTLGLGPVQIKSFQYVRSASGVLPEDCVAEYTFDEGPKNKMSLSGKSKADIITSSPDRIDAAQGGIWQRVEQLIGQLDFQGLVRIEEPVNGVYTAVFRKETDPHAVKGSISTIWPEVKLTYNGLEVNGATEYDFSHNVEIVAKADLFGHKGVTQTVVLRFKEDLSHECELLALSLAKEHNPGLLVDLVADVASQTIVITPQATDGAINTPARVVLTFKLSDGAVLKLANELLESGITHIDLTEPRMLTVVAANGTPRHYELLLQPPQTIGWTLGNMSYEYGSVPVPVEASASSGLPLTFTSTHPEVATVAGGRLHIVCPGTTTLAALQPGEGIWAEAKPISRQVTVTKRPITVRMRDVLYKAGYPVVTQYEYSNLAKDADTASIPSPYEQGCFTVKDAEGRGVALPSELPVGVYTVDTVEGKHLATSCYTISPQSARFEVVQADRWQVKISVRNADGALSGATVLLGMEKRLTDNGGDATWYLPAGGKYLFEVRMPGYAPATVEVFTEQRNIAQTVTLQEGTIELKYTVSASAEGRILGPTFQRLAPNSVPEEVCAVPAEGYSFAQWSDGKLDNPRRDAHLTQSVEFMAQFSREQVLLRYTAARGGTLKNGAVEQKVDYGADGPTVEAVPDSGYYFQGWSDGVATPVRTDRAVTHDVLVEAVFGKYYTIPATEDFELGVLGNGWYSESKGKSYNPWGITTIKQSDLEPLDGHYAYCNSDAMGRNGRTESYLYTPCYRLGNAWSGDLIVSFDYGSKNVNARTDQFWVELSVDTGAWVKIGEVEHNTRRTLLLTVLGSELEGKRTVQFRWGYKAMWAYAVGIDNVVIAKKSNEKLNLQSVADPTGSCTFDKLRDDGALDVPNITAQEVIAGERPAVVRANPAPGFTFVSWEDGSTDSIRMPKRGVYISQTFTATCRNMLKSTITYQVAPAGAGVCRMDGQDVAMPNR